MRLTELLPYLSHLMGVDRRGGGRITKAPAKCSLGKVLDISATGVRLRANGIQPRTQQLIRFTLACSHGVYQMVGQVAWTKRYSLVSYDMGISFLELTPDATLGLNAIVRDALGEMTIEGMEADKREMHRRARQED